MSEVIPVLRRELSILDEDMAKLRGELDRIQGRLKLANDKAERIRAVVQLYDEEGAQPHQQGLFTETASVSAPEYKRSDSRVRVSYGDRNLSGHGPKRLIVKQAAIDLIQPKGSAHRNEILQVLIDRGIMGHEKSPIGSLAAYLSEFKDTFEADGRGNYSLRAQTSYEPQPAADAVGSVEAANSASDPEPAFNTEIVVEGERQVVHDNIT